MNWNTKAKTRAGRGRNKDDIENQQRLAAWNKLPKKKINGKCVAAVVEGHNGHPDEDDERPYTIFGPQNQYSDDLLMLGTVMSEYGVRDKQLMLAPTSSYNSPPKFMPCDDPLFLLELTV